MFAVFKVLDELKFKHYHSQMDKYLQLFHRRPVAAALYQKVSFKGFLVCLRVCI